jgi:hypothetical protein
MKSENISADNLNFNHLSISTDWKGPEKGGISPLTFVISEKITHSSSGSLLYELQIYILVSLE